MLREKSGSVKELHAVIQASARERLELSRQHRTDQQEDALFRLKEVMNTVDIIAQRVVVQYANHPLSWDRFALRPR
jgi:hypothetical protein